MCHVVAFTIDKHGSPQIVLVEILTENRIELERRYSSTAMVRKRKIAGTEFDNSRLYSGKCVFRLR